jgi:hypothetical protein
MNDLIITGNVDSALIKRVYRLFTTPAGSLPFDRSFGIDMSALDNTPAALEGALLVEYTQKLNMYYPELTISQLTFSQEVSTITPRVVLAYA